MCPLTSRVLFPNAGTSLSATPPPGSAVGSARALRPPLGAVLTRGLLPRLLHRAADEELGRQRARRAAQRGAADAPSRAARDLGPVFAVKVLCGFWRVLNRATLPQLPSNGFSSLWPCGLLLHFQ